MRSLEYSGNSRVEIVERAAPTAGPGQALVRVEASLICGSERRHVLAGMDGNAGHEASGILLSVPEGAPFSVGERVGLSAVSGCGRCDRCLAGRELHCRDGVTGASGWHSEIISAPLAALRSVGAGATAARAALMSGDALGVPSRAFRRVPSAPGDVVVVVGLGPIGLGHVLVRSFAGAKVIGVEPSAYRRAQALEAGAAEVWEPGAYAGQAALVIECTGVAAVVQSAFGLVEPGGTLLQSGECKDDIAVNPSSLFVHREVNYTGSWFYSSEDYPFMRRLVDAGLPLETLMTHEVDAADAQGAMDDFLAGESGKVLLRWS